jgi:hypothetical protein
MIRTANGENGVCLHLLTPAYTVCGYEKGVSMMRTANGGNGVCLHLLTLLTLLTYTHRLHGGDGAETRNIN